jgi:hypothetical protein
MIVILLNVIPKSNPSHNSNKQVMALLANIRLC